MISVNAPLPSRIGAYLLERFPPVAYTVLVGLFTASAYALVEHQTEASAAFGAALRAGAVVLLVFLHLRLMDEHKDHEADAVAYPDRCLSRGVVSLPLLFKVGVAAVVVQGALVLSLSSQAVVSWLACLVFTVLMRFEFGIGRWLNRHLLVYAISHNPVVGLLAFFLWTVAGGAADLLMWLYIAIVSVGSLAFEIGRKIRLPEEEVAGVESYSSVLGKRRADWLLAALRLLTGCGLLWLGMVIGQSTVGAIALGAQVVLVAVLLSAPRRAKLTEGLATLGLLLDFVFVWVIAC